MTRISSLNVVAIAAAAALCSVWPAPLFAQEGKRAPDAKRGETIAAQGTANVPACAQCHAVSGPSDPSGTFPHIAGQPAFYLVKQMHDFASSERDNALMSPFAKALSAEDIADVSEYYAGVSGQFLPPASPDPTLVEKGRTLARVGDAAKSIQACNNCHGPDGTGLPPAIPYLAGQYAQYITLQLQMWQRGERKDAADSMGFIAKQLDEQQIAAVAAFYQQARSAAAAAK